VNPERGFWAGRRVLVTGHTGFKGAWLCMWLEKLGARVQGLALAPDTAPNLFDLSGLAGRVESRLVDIRDFQATRAAVASAAPEIVFHLAAQSLVRRSYADPVDTYAVNVMGTVHLLQALRECSEVRAVVNVTSDKCYDNREWPWAYRETDALGGYDPYSSSKACAEIVSAAWRSSFANAAALATARAGNVIGGGDWAQDRLIPDFVRAVSAGTRLSVRNPSAVRPWQHVLEPLAGYLILAQRLMQDANQGAAAWNFAPFDHESATVAQIAQRVVELWGGDAAWVTEASAPRVHEAHYLRVDASKARAVLGWRPRLSLDQALLWTVEWYRRQHAGEDARTLTLSQIEAYTELSEAVA
jgi:CDP-glucose 4,6-dehydratase